MMSARPPSKRQCVTPEVEQNQWFAPLSPPITKLDQLLKYKFTLSCIAKLLSQKDLSQFRVCNQFLLKETTPILTGLREWSFSEVQNLDKDGDLYGPSFVVGYI